MELLELQKSFIILLMTYYSRKRQRLVLRDTKLDRRQSLALLM